MVIIATTAFIRSGVKPKLCSPTRVIAKTPNKTPSNKPPAANANERQNLRSLRLIKKMVAATEKPRAVEALLTANQARAANAKNTTEGHRISSRLGVSNQSCSQLGGWGAGKESLGAEVEDSADYSANRIRSGTFILPSCRIRSRSIKMAS